MVSAADLSVYWRHYLGCNMSSDGSLAGGGFPIVDVGTGLGSLGVGLGDLGGLLGSLGGGLGGLLGSLFGGGTSQSQQQ
jgi:hypothetical protein